MDCFIIRVYRHTAQENGQPGEIAGLVERVGRMGNGKPFTSYTSLVSALRETYTTEAANLTENDNGPLRLVHTAKQR